jgi:hypothetical protein
MMNIYDGYLIVTKNKHDKVISSTPIFGDIDMAKDLMGMLIYQTGVRTGQLFKREKDKMGRVVGYNILVEEREIYHYGE